MESIENKFKKEGIEIIKIDKLDIKHSEYIFYGILLKDIQNEDKIKENVEKILMQEGYINKKERYCKGLDGKGDLKVKEFSYGHSIEDLKRKTKAKYHNRMVDLLKFSFPGMNLINDSIDEN